MSAVIPVEALSQHPLANAIVRDGTQRLRELEFPEERLKTARDGKSITGRGVSAIVGGETVFVGKDDLFNEVEGPPLPGHIRNVVDELESEGRTTMIVRSNDRYLGTLGLMDAPREDAAATIAHLRRLGIKKMILLSGDNQVVAGAVARSVGIDEALGDLMPDDKVESIKRLRSERSVAMVGDGVNDAPAMAHASVGVAMGAAGSDVALETAEVALMGDSLENLPFAIGLSRMTSRIIKQNVWFSLGMVAFLVPATIFGLKMAAAVALHEGSTLVVVLNALRLLGFRKTPN